MKIASIILNYNNCADCRKCIGYLKAQQGVEQEIIVVDNCSREDDRSAVEALCREFGCTFIANNENKGYNAGNNVGLRYAAEKGYEFALIANPDMEFPQTDYLATLVAQMQTDDDIVVCGSDIVTPQGVHQNPKKRGTDNLRGYFNWITDIFGRNKKRNDNPEWIEDPAISKYCRCLNGCCFLIRMNFIERIGFFDENTFLYGEEPILGSQVEENGKKMYYTANTFAVHAHMKSKEGSTTFCNKHWKHSRLYYVKRYSKLPWIKKQLALMSIRLYFVSLNFKNLWKRKG
jgi:GT2 family glycosyltransferase